MIALHTYIYIDQIWATSSGLIYYMKAIISVLNLSTLSSLVVAIFSKCSAQFCKSTSGSFTMWLPFIIILLHLDLILNWAFESAPVANGKHARPPPNPQPLCLTSTESYPLTYFTPQPTHFIKTLAHKEVTLPSPTPSVHPYSEHTSS